MLSVADKIFSEVLILFFKIQILLLPINTVTVLFKMTTLPDLFSKNDLPSSQV